MQSVALVTYAKSANLTESDRLLLEPLRQEGFDPQPVPWDKRNIDWTQFAAVILRSAWNYHIYPEQFFSWLKELEERQIPVWNPVPTIRWNAEKTYLRDLAKLGIPIVPTLWVTGEHTEQLQTAMLTNGWEEIVVKPSIGASAHEVTRFRRDQWKQIEQKIRILSHLAPIMVQPLMHEVYEGELSIVFIGGKYSHTVRKIPKPGEFRSNYDYGGKEILFPLTAEDIVQAETIYAKLNHSLLYARLDAIMVGGVLTVMEVELIEPKLFFTLFPPAATHFARSLRSLTKLPNL